MAGSVDNGGPSPDRSRDLPTLAVIFKLTHTPLIVVAVRV
jgi:hypothetical protein